MICNRWVVWAQWLALVAMTVEHLARFALPISDAGVALATLLGRIALPLFAGMIAWHLLHNSRNHRRYVWRLLGLAVVAQVPFILVVGWHLNIVFAFALGVAVCCCPGRLRWVALVGALLAAPFIEYGVPGVLLVPVFVLAFRFPGRLLAAVPLLVCAYVLNGYWVFSVVSLLVAVLLVVIGSGYLRVSFDAIKMPRLLWLSWYPLHLYMVLIVSSA